MSWLKRRYRNRLLIFAVGVGVSLWPGASLGADPDPPGDPHKGIREETLRFIAPGTPDDLLRLREAFEKRGQEIARLRLAIPSEKEEEFAEKQKKLKELRDRLAESEALLQLLDSSSSEVSREQLDQVYAKEREQLRKELSSRTDELKRSIADLKKEVELAEKPKKLKELRDRLAESEALLQLLDSSSIEVSRKQLDQVYAKEREQLRKELSSRTDELKRSIADLEKGIGSGQVQYLKTLEEEREALARLIAVRREWLLAEYQSLSGCSTDDRSCVARKLKVLCRLSPLFPTGSRAPIITLIQDVSDQLHLGGGTTSSLCDYLSHDFGS